jgi:hypothetical protein
MGILFGAVNNLVSTVDTSECAWWNGAERYLGEFLRYNIGKS